MSLIGGVQLDNIEVLWCLDPNYILNILKYNFDWLILINRNVRAQLRDVSSKFQLCNTAKRAPNTIVKLVIQVGADDFLLWSEWEWNHRWSRVRASLLTAQWWLFQCLFSSMSLCVIFLGHVKFRTSCLLVGSAHAIRTFLLSSIQQGHGSDRPSVSTMSYANAWLQRMYIYLFHPPGRTS